MYKCEIIADSISPQSHRLTTYKVTYPRIIHAEMCRHRILSRNSASSRAIPFKKMVKMVEEDPFIPIAWQKDHKGMQGTEYITDPIRIEFEVLEHLHDRDKAIESAKLRNNRGVTKQICNRYLEPFLWHTEIISGTEWSNFFELRCPKYWLGNPIDPNSYKSKKDAVKALTEQGFAPNPPFETWDTLEWLKFNQSQAEIHIQAIAEMMWDAMNESTPKQLQAGEWHIPMGDNIDIDHLFTDNTTGFAGDSDEIEEAKIKIATARCARISYTTLGDYPKVDYQADVDLHDHLIVSKHWSPFEHCAKVMNEDEYYSFVKGGYPLDKDGFTIINENSVKAVSGWCNNFRGFIQYRYMVENR